MPAGGIRFTHEQPTSLRGAKKAAATHLVRPEIGIEAAIAEDELTEIGHGDEQ